MVLEIHIKRDNPSVDFTRIKSGVKNLVEQNAPKNVIDSYISDNNTSIEELKNAPQVDYSALEQVGIKPFELTKQYGRDLSPEEIQNIASRKQNYTERTESQARHGRNIGRIKEFGSGASMGLSDLAMRNITPENYQMAKEGAEDLSGAERLALNIGGLITGGAVTGLTKAGAGVIAKGSTTGSKIARGMAIAGGEGAVYGGATSEGNLIEKAKSAIKTGGLSALTMGALGTAGAGTSKVLPKFSKATRKAEESLYDVVKKEGNPKILSEGLDSSKKVAKSVQEASEKALDESNEKVAKTLEDALGRDRLKLDTKFNSRTGKREVISGAGKTQGKKYGDVIEEVGEKSIKKVSTSNNLTQNQTDLLKKALKEGSKSTTKGKNSIEAVNEAKKYLSSEVNKAVMSGDKAAQRTAIQIENVLKDMLDTASPQLKKARGGISKAKGIENAYELGLNYKSTQKKFNDLKFRTKREEQAFKQGFKKNLVEEALSKSDNQNTPTIMLKNKEMMKDVLGDKKGKKLIEALKIDESAINSIKSLKTKSRNALEARGGLNKMISEARSDNINLIGGAGLLVDPVIGGGLLALNAGRKAMQSSSKKKIANALLRGQERVVRDGSGRTIPLSLSIGGLRND